MTHVTNDSLSEMSIGGQIKRLVKENGDHQVPQHEDVDAALNIVPNIKCKNNDSLHLNSAVNPISSGNTKTGGTKEANQTTNQTSIKYKTVFEPNDEEGGEKPLERHRQPMKAGHRRKSSLSTTKSKHERRVHRRNLSFADDHGHKLEKVKEVVRCHYPVKEQKLCCLIL